MAGTGFDTTVFTDPVKTGGFLAKAYTPPALSTVRSSQSFPVVPGPRGAFQGQKRDKSDVRTWPWSFGAIPLLGMAAGRRRKRRGETNDRDIDALADMYLKTQRKLWPDLEGMLPTNTKANRAKLVQQFNEKFSTDNWSWSESLAYRAIELAACYVRFSDENSNPRSLAQQLLNILEWLSLIHI